MGLVAVGGVLALAALAALIPIDTSGLESHPHPAQNYADALGRIHALQAGEGADIQPACRTLLLSHGRRTARAVVLLHGLTNCPRQFESLGRLLWAAGDNVLILRLPRHGLADRMTLELSSLTARELAHATDEAVDIGRGLGDRVTVSGLSVGGVAAAWAASERSDVDRAVVIAPLLGVAAVPTWLTHVMTNLWLLTPNRFHWWDSRRREQLPGPAQVYPRFATRALGETLRLAECVRAHAARRGPAAREVVLVQVPGDQAVNNAAIAVLAAAWHAHGGRVERYEFPARFHLQHDLIDPAQVGARPELVYPVLARWLR